MKTIFKNSSIRLVMSVALIITGVLGVTFASPSAAQDISTTKHNLGSSGTGANNTATTGEICVFCHTPHGSDTSAAVPLWNRTLSLPGAYTTYDNLGTVSLDAEILPVGSVSLACLSCHDGTQAMDAMINEPGSGFNSIGSFDWTGSTNMNTVTGKLTGDAALGVDLQNDHPVGVQFAGIATGVFTTAIDGDFNSASRVGTTDRWYVETGGVTGKDKTDLMLYTRDNSAGGGGAAEPFVECATCHDPHSNNAVFLRISNSGSGVCLACHNK